jgi:hypothetical protein
LLLIFPDFSNLFLPCRIIGDNGSQIAFGKMNWRNVNKYRLKNGDVLW